MISINISKYENKQSRFIYESIWSPDYQRILIDEDSSKHDWLVELDSNQAKIISANNHKFEVQFDSKLKNFSCNCQKFIDEELNWCQHISVLNRIKTFHWKTFNQIKHSNKPNLVFYNSQEKTYFYPPLNKFLNSKELLKLNHVFSNSISNIKNVVPLNGVIPHTLNPFPNIKLYGYQESAILHMLKYKRSILSLEMGWGKTLCALVCCYNLLKNNPELKILIACPKSLKAQWEKEILKYFNNSVQSIKNSKETLNNSTFTIVNYEMARNYKLKDSYDIIILDEVQKIKNKNTKSWKGISKINSEWCWALSGTVVENNVEDFLAITDILRPELFRVRWKFYYQFCEIDRKFVKGFKNSEELNDILKTIIYRAPNTDCPFSINLEQKLIKVGMTPTQKSTHDKFYFEVKKLLAKSMQTPLNHYEKLILSAYQTKSRLAADAEYMINNKCIDLPKKIKSIMEIIENTDGKIVIFSEWKEFLSIIESQLNKKSIKYVRFDGSLSQKQRKNNLEQFIQNPDIKIFSSTDAGGTGVDGLQLVSSTLIHAQMPWNPARIQQREGRLVRIGQSKNVKTYMIITSGSIEESMILTHERKNLIKNVILDV